MEPTFESLESAVMRLPLRDRARMLEHLVRSMQADAHTAPADLDAAWGAVADAREAALQDGTAQEVPLDETMPRLRAAL